MVFFTCNHCGESVKKAAVEKHYFTKCRGAPKSISCMDCQKDFQDNYVEHRQCITEMQKYSGKDYVPRESQNSGAKKQEGWTEVVRSVLDSEQYNLRKETREAFLTLQTYDNIPRKKAKFLNFVTNSVRLQRKTVEEVWNILEKEQEKMKQARQAQLAATPQGKQSAKGNDDDRKEQIESVNNNNDEMKENTLDTRQNGHDEDSRKKKKKLKKLENEEKASEEHTLENGHTEMEPSKKKKKKNKIVDEVPQVEVIQQNGHTAERKKDKKKRKVEAETAEPTTKMQRNDEIEAANNIDTHLQEKQSKKKKHKDVVQNGSAGDDEPTKKKQKMVETNNGKQENSNDTYQFCWNTELARVTAKYPDGVTLEKLKRKLFKKFKTKFETEIDERQKKGFEKKLNKKLKKSTTLKLEGDIVKACS